MLFGEKKFVNSRRNSRCRLTIWHGSRDSHFADCFYYWPRDAMLQSIVQGIDPVIGFEGANKLASVLLNLVTDMQN